MQRLIRWCLVLFVVGMAFQASSARGADDELVAEFKKYFKKYKDTPTRVEAVLSLKGEQSPAVVEAMLPVLKDKENEVVRAAIEVLAEFKSQKPIRLLMIELEETKDEPVRLGILEAVARGAYALDPALFYETVSDKSWEVRRRGINAIVAAAMTEPAKRMDLTDPEDKPKRLPKDWPENPVAAIAPLCTDSEVAVRCAALEGLANLKAPEVVQPAIALLNDDIWQVRASAIQSLAKVRHRDSIEPLILRMQLEEGRLVADICSALGELTGRKFGQRKDGWLTFWETFKDKFVMPTDEQMATLREAMKKSAALYTPPGSVSYHGIQTPSRRILFVIDVSGSMENEVIEKERFADGGYPSMSRMDIVKTELARTIEGLEDYVEFNVESFATKVDHWKKGLVKANVLNKSSAMDWVNRLEALGGNSNADLARAGLTASANMEAGKTNTYGALMEALNAAGGGLKDKEYEVAVDTIFFLSDGRPSTGEFVDTEDILREVLKANELRKVVIHTIAIGEFQKSFMQRLAEKSGGVFVDLGR